MPQVKPSAEDRQRLSQLISQWNVDHYDLFELSNPNEDLEFHGVVRFFFQGGGAHVATKCIRVSSTATTKEVIDVLIEKFRPDMRMLTQNRYALYEVHVTGEERRLLNDEKPLVVQLNWGKDVREGRFLLKNEDEPTIRQGKEVEREPQGFKRNLSKREKKELKKKREREKKEEKAAGVAEKLYNDLPENSFTRSISNPEAVMRRRRQQKLEKKMEQMRAEEGRPDAVETTCGTLKIYGESVRPDVPYKTLLLSTGDTSLMVVKEALEKYGLPNEDPEPYCLYQVLLPPGGIEYHGGAVGEEILLEDHECPLAIVMQHPKNRGHIIFQLRRKPTHIKKKTKRAVSHDDLRANQREPNNVPSDRLPYLQELNSRDGRGKRHHLPLNVTEIGSERSMSNSNQYLQLMGNDIKPRHCVVAHTEGIVTVTPTSRDAETYVENTRIFETTMLKHGMVLQFGKHHVYRFCDPRFDEAPYGRPMDSPMQKAGYSPNRPQETNFDVDGHVEPVNNLSPKAAPRKSLEWNDMQRSPHSQSPKSLPPSFSPADGGDQLPASLEFRDEAEDALLSAVILDVNSRAVQFKLASTYTLYMAMRHLLAQRYQRPQRISDYVMRISKFVQRAIQDQHNDPTALAFWMANASEILHFFKMDRDAHQYSPEAHEMLAEAVQMAFHHLVRCLQGDLQRVMAAFLDPSDMVEDEAMDQQRMNPNRPTLGDVITTLSAAMTLLRRCRVNAALTIQLFSQLFHFINMWLFNMIVSEPQLQMCTSKWGNRLKRRLGKIEVWAEKQGLELAADCHLCRIIQAAHLLQAPKTTQEDINNITSTCFKLNSEQMRCLLTQYIPDANEPPISHQFVHRLVSLAESMADLSTRSEGREVTLEEDQDLHLPFLLPEDGYSCDNIRGIPNGLPEFIKPLTISGICQMIPNNNSSGSWTVYMGEPRSVESTPPKTQSLPSPSIQQSQNLPREPEIQDISFNKVDRSMGLSIVAAIGENQRERGIYIKSVVANGAAALDGRLQTGDQLLSVDGRSLVGVTQDRAAELMRETGDRVTLKVAKQGAIYHGLATFLSQASPTLQRAANTPQKGEPQMNGRRPYPDEQLPPYTESPKDVNRMDMTRSQPSPRPQQMPIPQMRNTKPQQRSAMEQLMGPNSSSPHQQRNYDPNYRREMQDVDPRSKSTSNLLQDPGYNKNYDPHAMKPAASVSVLHQPPGHFPPGVRRDNPQYGDRMPDYENQVNISSAPNGRPIIDTQKAGRDPRFQDMNHNLMPNKPQGPVPSQSYLHPNQRPADRSSMSSRTSTSSNRENIRPQSAYFDPNIRNEDQPQMRPKSMEVTANKIHEWQDKMDDRSQPYRNDYTAGKADNSPPYSNIDRDGNMNGYPNRPYASTQDIPRITMSNERTNLYENTSPSQPDLRASYNQPNKPEFDMKPKPKVAPKPAVAPKPSMASQQQQQPHLHQSVPDISVNRPDNRYPPNNQYNPRLSNGPAPSNFNTHIVQQPVPHNQNRHDPRSPQDPRNKFSPPRENGGPGFREQVDFPPPPSADTPPDLPPPPVLDNYHEESPPLPPPPNPQDFMIDQQLQEEQKRLLQQMNETDQRRASPGMYPNDRRMPPGPSEQDKFKAYPNDRPLRNNTPVTQHNIPNYQNISFNGVGTNQGPPATQQPTEHNVYEPYEPKKSPNFQNPSQEPIPPWQQGQATHLTVGDPEYSAASPWVREKKERDAEEQEQMTSRRRQQEISMLESKSYLNMQEQERLRKLRLEEEFQRRVKEVVDKGEYDEESDEESAERLYSRERMIQQIQEDLTKVRARMEDLNRRRLQEDFEREKDRMQRLERRLEMFEKEREDHKARLQKRQERKQREHAEQIKKQRELHEKQRQNYEEQKRQLLAEEEKMRQRREEEINKRRLMERERLQELQAQREAEEKQYRAEARQREEEYSRQRLLQQQQQRLFQQRDIKVSEERRRIDSMNMQNQSHIDGYQQYANLPPDPVGKENQAPPPPPPPERNSSYDLFNQRQNNMSAPDDGPGVNYRDLGPPSSLRSDQTTKKSVSFNTQLETNVYSDHERSPLNSQSSYRSSQSSDVNVPADSYNNGVNEVFDTPPHANNVTYLASESTPGVIGAQEIYRDPRTRINEAKKASENPIKKQADRMSFRDKMKYFAKEAGEDTIKKRPKSSSTQRAIESQMNGQ